MKVLSYLRNNWREVGWTFPVFIFSLVFFGVWLGLTMGMWFVPDDSFGPDPTLRHIIAIQIQFILHKLSRI